MISPKDTRFKILYTYFVLIPLVIDTIIFYHAERRIIITLKAKLLSYILLKVILLPVHESTIHLYNNKPHNQFTELIILV